MIRRHNNNSLLPRFPIAKLLIAAIIPLIFVSCGSNGDRSKHPNVLLITIDGIRSDKIGPGVKKVMEMPVFDRLWTLGSTFTGTIVASPQRTPSYASIFTGLYPPVHGVRTSRTDRLPAGALTMAEIFKKEGYKTGAVVSNVDAMGIFGLDQGFDFYDDDKLPAIEEDGLPQPPWSRNVDAQAVTSIAVQWIAEAGKEKKPWFMWVQYSDALPPRKAPFPFNELFKDNPLAAELAYIDANLGILTGKLSDMGIDKNTLVVITSANGNPQGEHGESGNPIFTYLSTIMVPSVFYFRGKIPAGKDVTQFVSSTDLMPTILGLTGIRKPRRLDGLDLSKTLLKQKPLPEREMIYSENMFLSAWHNWMPVLSAIGDNYHFITMKSAELYDISNDPGEENNLADANAGKAESMQKLLDGAVEDMEKRRIEDIDELNEIEKNFLKSLAESKTVSIREMPSETANISKARMQGLLLQLFSRDQDAGEEQTQEGRLQEILKEFPNYPFAQYLYADILFRKGELDPAFKTYEKVLGSGSRFLKAAALVKMSRILALQNKSIEAEKILKGVLQIVPNNPGVYTDLGNILMKQNLPEEAEIALREALKIDPDYYKARYNLALLYVSDNRRIPAALVEIDAVLNKNPNYVPALLLGAKIAVITDKPDNARKHLNKILELVPSDSPPASEAKKILETLDKPGDENAQ